MMGRKEAILKLRQVLIRRRDALRKALAGDLSSLKELRQQASGDMLDAALDSAQDEISSQLAEVESRELAQIETALERMRMGTYGICEVTGRQIPLARLQALPYATMCIEAQREAEKGGLGGSPVCRLGQRDRLPWRRQRRTPERSGIGRVVVSVPGGCESAAGGGPGGAAGDTWADGAGVVLRSASLQGQVRRNAGRGPQTGQDGGNQSDGGTACSVVRVGISRDLWGLCLLLAVLAKPATGQFSLTSQLTKEDRDRLFREVAEDVAALERQGNVLKKVVVLAKPTVVHIDAKKPTTESVARRSRKPGRE